MFMSSCARHGLQHVKSPCRQLHVPKRHACCIRLHAHATSTSPTDVISWATGSSLQELPCSLVEMPGKGRGLIAKEDIAPGSTLLAVPFDRLYSSAPEHELDMHWSADMAFRLLRDKHQCKAEIQKTEKTNQWGTWIESLPVHVTTPLEFGQEEIAEVKDAGVAAEVEAIQKCIQACYEELEPSLTAMGYTWTDYLNAVQVLHSRCFFQPETGCHIAVPGVDMCNHSATPSAQVEVVHSPGAVQGLQALSEVADVDTVRQLAQEPSRFMLKAGPAGIRKGDEITISYGPWPDTAFFLLFGFLPEDNPHNSVMLFQDLIGVARALLQHLGAHSKPSSSTSSTGLSNSGSVNTQQGMSSSDIDCMVPDDDIASALVATVSPATLAGMTMFVTTKDGWDARLRNATLHACQALKHMLNQSDNGSEIKQLLQRCVECCDRAGTDQSYLNALTREVVRLRCLQRLNELSQLSHVEYQAANSDAVRVDVGPGQESYAMTLAKTFTHRQRVLLQTALNQM